MLSTNYSIPDFETRVCECMVVSVLSPGLLSPTYEASDDAHLTTWHRYSSSISITPICQLPGLGMGMKLLVKNRETVFSY
jgi:hypothetical protein